MSTIPPLCRAALYQRAGYMGRRGWGKFVWWIGWGIVNNPAVTDCDRVVSRDGMESRVKTLPSCMENQVKHPPSCMENQVKHPPSCMENQVKPPPSHMENRMRPPPSHNGEPSEIPALTYGQPMRPPPSRMENRMRPPPSHIEQSETLNS